MHYRKLLADISDHTESKQGKGYVPRSYPAWIPRLVVWMCGVAGMLSEMSVSSSPVLRACHLRDKVTPKEGNGQLLPQGCSPARL